MVFLRNFVIALVAVASLSACELFEDKKPGDTTAPGDRGFTEEGVSTIDTANITPGSKEEFIAVVGDRVFFEVDSSNLTSDAQETLKKQAEWLKQYSSFRVVVEGHADERGTREYNLALGERRATSTKNYLASLGVEAGRLSTISYGKEHPEYLGSNDAAWNKNRRAVSVVE